MTDSLVILLGGLVGGFVSGLTGFGTGLTALPIWLLVLSPAQAGTLVIACSVVGQVQTFPAIRHAIEWPRASPFIFGGLAGVPIGVWLLDSVTPTTFKFAVGLLLTGYCCAMWMLRSRTLVVPGNAMTDAIVGWLGGVLGGLAGLSGVLPTIWTGLRGWGKAARRAVFQPYNLSVLVLALIAHVVTGFVTRDVMWMLVAALPGTVTGAAIGRRIYERMPDAAFHTLVLGILGISGVALVVGNLGG